MNAQLKSIVAHLTLVGWIVSLILNNSEKDDLTSFYLRQTLGIYLLGLVGTLIPALRIVIGIIVLVLWIISLIGAIQQEKKEIPVVGTYFQDWFKGIN
ncbi:hypothetical protein [Gaoshiqia sediminis]|uniref:Import component protein n=1 Tax=Gaoshiqia sediminis TaxID=2986998 RepID=A0AA41Y7Z9_9BACT|nr:hypothetical protein [Gaoshiqia sediminis]MCW0482812.1 hypothetical protein [Gaoshiqia sediminis]